MLRKEDTPLRINTPQPKSRGIFIATNRVNSKQFVGMDINMPLQFHQHVTGSAKCQMLHEALSDTGLENWNVQFIPYPKLSLKDLQAVKRWYIHKLNTEYPNGYNPPLVSNGNLERSENVLQLLKARVRERRKAGALLATIGAEFGIDSTTVGRWCEDINFAKVVRDSPLRTQVRERRKAGETLQTIAAESGISTSTASRWCEDIKVPTPTETEVIGLLADGQVWTPSGIQQHSKVTRQAVMLALKRLLENGRITRIKKGCYQKSGEGAQIQEFLTDKQRSIFDFVRQKIYDGMPPTQREISEHIGVSGKAAYDHLQAIAKKGFIRLSPGKTRSIFLRPPYKDASRHTLIADAGVPQLDIQKGDFLHINTNNPVATEGDLILSDQGKIKQFAAGDVTFGKIVGVSRRIQ